MFQAEWRYQMLPSRIMGRIPISTHPLPSSSLTQSFSSSLSFSLPLSTWISLSLYLSFIPYIYLAMNVYYSNSFFSLSYFVVFFSLSISLCVFIICALFVHCFFLLLLLCSYLLWLPIGLFFLYFYVCHSVLFVILFCFCHSVLFVILLCFCHSVLFVILFCLSFCSVCYSVSRFQSVSGHVLNHLNWSPSSIFWYHRVSLHPKTRTAHLNLYFISAHNCEDTVV